METAGRVRLMDYSDSDSDDDIHNNEGIAPPPHAQGDAPPPETENELAKIKVTGLRIGEILSREGILSAAYATSEAQIPMSPIATPAATVPTAPGWGQGPARAEVTVTESEASIDEGPEPMVTSVSTQPHRTRSTGKKAPRAEIPSSLRRLNQAARKTGSCADSRQQHAVEPPTPYDDPKYCSPLTITAECGNQKPLFKFQPTPDTVEELWAEYRHGLRGQPPVEQLEVKYLSSEVAQRHIWPVMVHSAQAILGQDEADAGGWKNRRRGTGSDESTFQRKRAGPHGQALQRAGRQGIKAEEAQNLPQLV
ncbi:hypothetical protein COL922a_012121 [Colletotrichum nupharicola]|nr:hypothetical protein COL922a_012121 [Colletotrichum nupharicola]